MSLCVDLDVSPVSFSADRRRFARAIDLVTRVALPRTTLEHVSVRAEGAALALTASAGAFAIRQSVPAAVAVAGEMLVPAARLAAVARCGRGPIAVKGDTALVDGVTSDLRPIGAPTKNPPSGPRAPALARLPSEEVVRMLRRVSYAMSADATRPHLCGARVERAGGTLRMVATDGHRLVVARTSDPGPPFHLVVPRRAVDLVARMAAATSGSIALHADDTTVWFVAADGWLAAPRLDVEYPAWEHVVPAGGAPRVRATRRAVLDALAAVRPRGAERVDVDTTEGLLRLAAGDAAASIPAEIEAAVSGFAVNSRYLRELLVALDDEDVALAVHGPLDPLRVDASDGTIVVLMPMRR